jgi:hypothetical protein
MPEGNLFNLVVSLHISSIRRLLLKFRVFLASVLRAYAETRASVSRVADFKTRFPPVKLPALREKFSIWVPVRINIPVPIGRVIVIKGWRQISDVGLVRSGRAGVITKTHGTAYQIY